MEYKQSIGRLILFTVLMFRLFYRCSQKKIDNLLCQKRNGGVGNWWGVERDEGVVAGLEGRRSGGGGMGCVRRESDGGKGKMGIPQKNDGIFSKQRGTRWNVKKRKGIDWKTTGHRRTGWNFPNIILP